MSDEIYTLGAWKVKEGSESEFVDAWRALGAHFGDLPNPPGVGTLLQSINDPRQFYSFGPWRSIGDVVEMRETVGTAEEIAKLVALCDEANPGTFRVVATA
jgi:hypothetical protein